MLYEFKTQLKLTPKRLSKHPRFGPTACCHRRQQPTRRHVGMFADLNQLF